jgi:glycosyltransferase involved in cell wall biosynthesis
MTRDKRIPDLIEAFARVVRRHPNERLRLVLIGDGPERELIARRIARLQLGSLVHLFGDIRDYSASCPFFVLARVAVLPGTGGLALNQAMTHGVPVIAARGDGTEFDLISEGTTGYLVSTGDKATLADRMERLLLAPAAEWRAMSTAVRAEIHEHANVEAMIAGLAAAVRHAAGPSAIGDVPCAE